jgi:hypothetical protein
VMVAVPLLLKIFKEVGDIEDNATENTVSV